MIGEHGDTEVAVWSSVNIGGLDLEGLAIYEGTQRAVEIKIT
nr:hypothetical protein [Ammoniphilus sp. YIM 78166]